MININIITPSLPFMRGFSDFYPLLKWEKKFKQRNIIFKFTNNLLDHFANSDIIIIDYRLLKLMGDRKEYDRKFIIDKLISIRKISKVVLFDTGDGTGSRCFWLTPYVDVHLKKQVFIDKERYTNSTLLNNYMNWVPNSILEDVYSKDTSYISCRKNDLEKIKVGWNIGLSDFRNLPLNKYLPFNKSILPNYIFKKSVFSQPNEEREYLVSYRGGVHSKKHYGYQRDKIYQILNLLSKDNKRIRTGGKISYNKFIKEMIQSRCVVSPFGWGEICYRDFEAIISGAILIKPDMSHIETYPNIYTNNKTYISVNWNLDDLIEKLQGIDKNYKSLKKIVYNSQEIFKNHQDSFELFYKHFNNIIIK